MDQEMRPMAIVSAAESESGATGKIAKLFNSRAVVFISGMIVMGVAAALIAVYTAPQPEEESWLVQINMNERERYQFTTVSTSHSETWTSDPDPRQSTSTVLTSNMTAGYIIEKLCDSDTQAFLKFLITNFTSDNDVLASMFPSNKRNTTDEEDFNDLLASVLEEQTFLARVAHNGSVTETDRSNLNKTMRHVFDDFVNRVTSHPCGTPQTPTDVSKELHDELTRIADTVVRQVQEQVYPYLQSSPAANVKVNSAWTRTFTSIPLCLNATYVLQEVRYESDGQPPVISPFKVGAVGGRRTSGDHAWFILKLGYNNRITDKDTYITLLSATLPKEVIAAINLHSVDVTIVMEGRLVVGADSGLVLDGMTRTNMTSFVRLWFGWPSSQSTKPSYQRSPSARLYPQYETWTRRRPQLLLGDSALNQHLSDMSKRLYDMYHAGITEAEARMTMQSSADPPAPVQNITSIVITDTDVKGKIYSIG